LLITLGATFLLLVLATLFLNMRPICWLAEEAFKKLCIFAIALAAGLLVAFVMI
jgi:hypothetical protein